jgi:hypothetical protein
MQIHHLTKSLKCHGCGYTFKETDKLALHFYHCRAQNSEYIKLYIAITGVNFYLPFTFKTQTMINVDMYRSDALCTLCDMFMYGKNTEDEHNCRRFSVCPVCILLFNNSEFLHNHLRTPDHLKKMNEIKALTGDERSLKLEKVSFVNFHHFNNGKLQCFNCFSLFTDNESLETHKSVRLSFVAALKKIKLPFAYLPRAVGGLRNTCLPFLCDELLEYYEKVNAREADAKIAEGIANVRSWRIYTKDADE